MFNLEEVKRKEKKWEKDISEPYKKKHPEKLKKFHTTDGEFKVKDVYSPYDVKDINYLKEINFPGDFPYTRGIYPTMYRGRPWTIRQYAGFGTPLETNKRYKYLLREGQNGLSIAFDLPTQLGFDSDDPRSLGEVGKVGVAVDSLKDMEEIFEDIPLDTVSTSMTINATAPVILALYVGLADKNGIPREKLRGTLQNDVLKEYIARGTYIYPPKASLRLTADIFEFCSKEAPKFNTISIGGYHIREAGSTLVQEIAFTLANATEYINAALKKGLDVDDFASRISFIMNSHNGFFEEIAKFRTFRKMWAKLMKEKFKAKKSSSLLFRTHIQTGGSTLIKEQPLNNIVRATVQAMSAALGGVQSMAISCYDEGLCIPTELAQTTAVRLQQILQNETGITNTIDPMAGSYYVEHLTYMYEKEANKLLEEIENIGGAVAAIEKGYMQKQVNEAAYKYQKEIETGKRIIVGLNKYRSEKEESVQLMRINPMVEKEKIENLNKLKSKRDKTKVLKSLEKIREIAVSDENIIYPIVDAAKNYVTVGEVCTILKEVFGEYRERTFI
ncbi:MAG: methylmalonyl-CoA mutase family protein [Atribacterota bacterium]